MFHEDGGFTSIAVALALLVSLTLVFSVATGSWVLDRSAEIQEIADAAAVSSQNVVAAYSTVFQTVDACVLSLGLAGTLLYGAGLIMSAVPGLSGTALEATDAARAVLDARRGFCESAERGLSAFESLMPALCMLESFAVVEANEDDGIVYTGLAVPFPQESLSSFTLVDDVSSEEMDARARELQRKSDEAKALKAEADAALERGWWADCGARPRCLRERAGHLGGLGDHANPDYPDPSSWSFGAAILRARAYYSSRSDAEHPYSSDIESVTDSICRERFYRYALTRLGEAYYHGNADGSVDLFLPDLPKNTDGIRSSVLYTERAWPSTMEEEGLTLHSTLSCPGASGSVSSLIPLSSIDSGSARECPVCRMSVGDMGKTVAASSSIDNGFEYWWDEVVAASEDFERAMDGLAEKQREMRGIAEEGKDAFQLALDTLSCERPKACPPGAWGSVAIVARGDGTLTPDGLAGVFSGRTSLPVGAAISGAVLAPDPGEGGTDVLSAFFDGVTEPGFGPVGILGGVCSLWGRLLVGYGSAAQGLGGFVDDLVSGAGSLFGAPVAQWLKSGIDDLVGSLGLEPADMRLRKPVLANTSDIFDRSGFPHMSSIRGIVEAIPAGGSAQDIARALGRDLVYDLDDPVFTIAELPIPGTGITVPLTIDLRKVVELL